jgi:hypothetical protein
MQIESCPHIIVPSSTGSTTFFHIISQTASFKGKKLWTIQCVLISLQLVPETFYILIRIFWTDFKKSSSFIKICQLGAELFHADRPMDMTKLTGDFPNFADAPQKELHSSDSHWIQNRLRWLSRSDWPFG